MALVRDDSTFQETEDYAMRVAAKLGLIDADIPELDLISKLAHRHRLLTDWECDKLLEWLDGVS